MMTSLITPKHHRAYHNAISLSPCLVSIKAEQTKFENLILSQESLEHVFVLSKRDFKCKGNSIFKKIKSIAYNTLFSLMGVCIFYCALHD